MAAKALRMLLVKELKAMSIRSTVQEYEYEGRYKEAPKIKLYVGAMKLQ